MVPKPGRVTVYLSKVGVIEHIEQETIGLPDGFEDAAESLVDNLNLDLFDL